MLEKENLSKSLSILHSKFEQRDVKGLYAKARAGELPNFTGISSPYEAPQDPEIRIDTTALSAEEAAEQIIDYLSRS